MLKLKNIGSFKQFITPAVKCSFLGLLIILAFGFNTLKHPFYLGLTELTYKGGPTIQLSLRLFTNDLEDALKKTSKKNIDLLNPKNKAEMDSILFSYISQRLSISINSKIKKLDYIGYEKEEESIWAYLEIKNTEVLKAISVENKILYDFLPQQTHIVRLVRFDVIDSRKINNPDSKVEFNF